jgi:hypothetical protein
LKSAVARRVGNGDDADDCGRASPSSNARFVVARSVLVVCRSLPPGTSLAYDQILLQVCYCFSPLRRYCAGICVAHV